MRIRRNEQTSDPHTRILRLDLPTWTHFKPGQWMSVKHHGIARSYSLLTREADAICVDQVSEGVLSPILCQSKEGDVFEVAGPYGAFTLPEPMPRNLLLIGCYTGMTPIHCLSQHLRHTDTSFTAKILDFHEHNTWPIEDLITENILGDPRFSYVRHTHHCEQIQPLLSDRPYVMAAGRTHFVKSVQALLKSAGYVRSQYALERFG